MACRSQVADFVRTVRLGRFQSWQCHHHSTAVKSSCSNVWFQEVKPHQGRSRYDSLVFRHFYCLFSCTALLVTCVFIVFYFIVIAVFIINLSFCRVSSLSRIYSRILLCKAYFICGSIPIFLFVGQL